MSNEQLEALKEKISLLDKEYPNHNEITEFSDLVSNTLFNKNTRGYTFGVCNDSLSQFIPIYEIGSHLMRTQFKPNFDEIEATYNTLKYSDRCDKMLQIIGMPYFPRKYYELIVLGRPSPVDECKLSTNDRIELIKKLFADSSLCEKFDIQLHHEVSFIHVKLLENFQKVSNFNLDSKRSSLTISSKGSK